MKTYGGVDLYTHIILTSHSLEVSGQLHSLAVLPLWIDPPVPIE
jgi:hypothetical protein